MPLDVFRSETIQGLTIIFILYALNKVSASAESSLTIYDLMEILLAIVSYLSAFYEYTTTTVSIRIPRAFLPKLFRNAVYDPTEDDLK